MKPVYANGMEFLGNPVEIRLAFFLGSMNGGKIRAAEVILAPIVAKALSRMMVEHIKEWEKDNGFINMPEDVKLLEGLFNVKLQHRDLPPENPDAD